jgi:hypothetical protein
MKLFKAYVCFSCKEVFDGAPYGKCPECGSENVYPLGWLERSDEERNRWFSLIQGRRAPLRRSTRGLLLVAATSE